MKSARRLQEGRSNKVARRSSEAILGPFIAARSISEGFQPSDRTQYSARDCSQKQLLAARSDTLVTWPGEF